MAADEKPGGSRLEDARARMYRDLIFESAECVFGARGFDGATMQEIASEAGVSLKTIYSSYPGKRELFEAIMHERGAAFHEHVRQAVLRAHGGPIEQLAAMTRAFVEFMFTHRDWLAIHLRSRIAWSVRPGHEVAAHLWRRGLEDLERLVAEGISAGVFVTGDPRELAVLLNTIMKVEATFAADRGETDPEPVALRTFAHLTRLLGVPADYAPPAS
jgi:TetR/AcrR family transcriptional regulator